LGGPLPHFGRGQARRVREDDKHTSKPADLLVILRKTETENGVRLELGGRMTANGIGELRREVDEARRRRHHVCLDLTEVTLLDRVSAEYLNSISGPLVVFENCPAYLNPWIRKR
jgi:hypothetical protein